MSEVYVKWHFAQLNTQYVKTTQMRRSARCSVKMTRETKCPQHPFSLKVPHSAHPLWPEKFLLSSWWKEGMRGKWEKECERILPKWGIICHHSLGGFWYLINSWGTNPIRQRWGLGRLQGEVEKRSLQSQHWVWGEFLPLTRRGWAKNHIRRGYSFGGTTEHLWHACHILCWTLYYVKSHHPPINSLSQELISPLCRCRKRILWNFPRTTSH